MQKQSKKGKDISEEDNTVYNEVSMIVVEISIHDYLNIDNNKNRKSFSRSPTTSSLTRAPIGSVRFGN